MATRFALDRGATEQTPVLRALVTLMNAETQPLEVSAALELLAEAARLGTMIAAVKSIAHG
jgi:hypothetical protein